MGCYYDTLPITFNAAKHFCEKNIHDGGGERIALYYSDLNFTYKQLHRYVKRTAGIISQLGLECEQRIAIVLPDSPELVWLFWGAIWAGCIPVPINIASSLPDMRYIIHDCRARLLATTVEWAEKLAPLPIEWLRHQLLIDGSQTLMSLLECSGAEPDAVSTCRDEPAFWLYTSGSTGRPKGVMHAHHDMAVCAELYGRQVVSLAKDDISYSVAKIPFAYGLGNTLYMPMAVGAAAVLSDASDTFRIIADVNKYRPTVFWGIPSVYANILALADVTLFDHAPIRLCVSAAEQLPKNIWVRFRERFGLEICEGIGTTEMLHIFLSNRPDGCHPGSSGWAVPGYTCRVIGLDGRQLDVGEIGELEVEGESLMLGYWNRYGETRSAIYGSAMRTGDLYRVDDEGLFYFVGRRDNIFKASGLWISPTEIEDVILRHGAVLACAVTHEHHPETDLPIVIAWLVLKPGYTPTKGLAADIRRRARGLVARYKVPKEIRFIEALPRTPTGKIDRSRLILPTTKQG